MACKLIEQFAYLGGPKYDDMASLLYIWGSIPH